MTKQPKPPARPRNIANDLVDALETATSKWTRQKKSEERHPGMVPMKAYMAASAGGRLPAMARQIFY
jgi:hypothetical protein